MKDDFDLKQRRSIPLPETVDDAFASIPWGEGHVSHTCTEGGFKCDRNDGWSFLESKNHVFYIGKLIREGIFKKMGKILGWKNDDDEWGYGEGGVNGKLYSMEYVETVLDYMFSHLKEGEKAQFVIGNVLSEVFNGLDDVKEAYDIESLKKKIYKIALRKFKKTEDDLEVFDLAEQDLHSDLFQVLRNNVSKESGELDVNKALGGANRIELSKKSSSLDVAKYLYNALSENDDLMNVFLKTLPRGQRFYLEENSVKPYYTLVEISLRLSEILNGRYVHGGPNRQGKYDDIIQAIIKGKHSVYQNLKELSALFQGVKFDTLHVDTEKSPLVIQKKKIMAWTRLGVLGLMAGLAGWGVFEMGRADQRSHYDRVQKLTQEKIRELIPEFYIRFESKHLSLTKQDSLKRFDEVLVDLRHDLEKRYIINGELQNMLMPALVQFVLHHPHKASILDDQHRIDIVDQFIMENDFLLRANGRDIKKPYEYLMKYKNDFDDFLESEPQEDIVRYSSNSGGMFLSVQYSYVGSVFSSDEDSEEYNLFYSLKRGGEKVFVDKGVNDNDPNNIIYTYSTERAKRGIRKLYDAVRRFDALKYQKYELLFNQILNRENEGSDYFGWNWEIEPNDDRLKILPDYKDSFGEFEYEMGVFNQSLCVEEENYCVEKPYLVARRADEVNFSTEVAVEAAKRWHEGARSHFPDNLKSRY